MPRGGLGNETKLIAVVLALSLTHAAKADTFQVFDASGTYQMFGPINPFSGTMTVNVTTKLSLLRFFRWDLVIMLCWDHLAFRLGRLAVHRSF
jgi:hypothetical protein